MNGEGAAPGWCGLETAVERYYRLHAPVYDLTRWTFLFGRSDILHQVAAEGSPERILEVGCGTGRNLAELGRLFPRARITGLDLSPAMLERAKKRTSPMGGRIELLRQPYDRPLHRSPNFDLVLFSYALTMFNPGFDAAIETAARDLAPGGRVAVVDFHDSTSAWFKRWVALNHVRVNGKLRPILQKQFAPLYDEVRPAYGGIWRYLLFQGRRN
jgi:S-adenosylmethionine-diacylgycerolhomoserine-N-methlytransferase